MKNIYLLYGENKEAIKDFSFDIVKKYLKNDINDFNYIKFNMQDNSFESLVYECSSSSFFSTKKVIIAENSSFFSNSKSNKLEQNIEILISYFNNINKDVILIFECNNDIDNRKKIVKELQKIGEIKKFDKFSDNQLIYYIEKYFKQLNMFIEKKDIEFLLEYSRLDFGNLKRELEKLSLINKDKITKEDIRNNVVKSLEYDIFSLTNELFAKNYIKFNEIYESLKIKGEDAVALLSLISSQIRVFYKVKILLLENFSQKDIAKKLAIHPYRVQLATQKVFSYNLDMLFDLVLLSKDYDKKLKSSSVDKYILLDIYILKLIQFMKRQ